MLQGRLFDLFTYLLSQRFLHMKDISSQCAKKDQEGKILRFLLDLFTVTTGVTCVNNIYMNLLST